MKWTAMWKPKNDLPSREIELETKDGTFYFFKADIHEQSDYLLYR